MKLISLDNKVFICGHNGMVGSAVVRSFEKKKYKNILTVSREKLDLTNPISVDKWFEINKPDVVVLAAAKVGGILANNNYPTEFLLENLKIQNNVIESSWKNGVKRFLFLGSSCIYPKMCKQPIKEEYLLSGPLEPTNESYALAKISGIKLCEAYSKQYKFNAISLMPTNLYGPGDNYNLKNSHVLPALLRKYYEAKLNNSESVICWGTGKPYREFLHVDDLGDACVYALENWDPLRFNSPKKFFGNTLYYLNVGCGEDISIKDLAEMVSNIVGYAGKTIWDESKPDGTPKKLLDVNNIIKLGWEPKITLKNGIKNTLNDFIENFNNKTIRE